MNPDARRKLIAMIKEYGPSLCNTPRSCSMMVRQACAEHADEAGLFSKALDLGIVKDLQNLSNGSWSETAARLSERLTADGVPDAEAAWIVDSWAFALGKHPEAAPLAEEKPLLEPPATPTQRLDKWNLLIVPAFLLGLVSLGIAGFMLFIYLPYLNDGVETYGVVVGFKTSMGRQGKWGRYRESYHPVVEYLNDRQLVGSTGSASPEYRVGEAVTVIYLPSDPDSAVLGSFAEVRRPPIIFGVLGLFAIMGAIVVRVYVANTQPPPDPNRITT